MKENAVNYKTRAPSKYTETTSRIGILDQRFFWLLKRINLDRLGRVLKLGNVSF
ncbi:MAG: hypothetical protein ACI9S8_002447 [Chlamydiales bacterium]|jgi:hypothetical protein